MVIRKLLNRSSTAQRLHCDHVFGTSLRQLDHFEQSLAGCLQRRDADAERKEDDVPPGEETGEPDRQKYQEKPNDAPEYTRTDSTGSTAFSLTHRKCSTRRLLDG